jgi:hypothetical protein
MRMSRLRYMQSALKYERQIRDVAFAFRLQHVAKGLRIRASTRVICKTRYGCLNTVLQVSTACVITIAKVPAHICEDARAGA